MLASHFSNPPRRSVSCQRRMPLQKSTRRWRHVFYQQAADRDFLAVEEARERREEERKEKRRKEDQEFLLKLAQVLRKWKVRVSTISFALVPATVSAGLVFGFIYAVS